METIRSMFDNLARELARVDKHNNAGVESGPQAEGEAGDPDQGCDVAEAKRKSDDRKRDGWKKIPKRTGRDRAGS